MKQLSKSQAILYHLYPGLIITVGFVILGPASMKYGFPPQFGMLIAIVLIVVPVLLWHLVHAKNVEQKASIFDINGFKERLPLWKLIVYSLGLVIFAFLAWGVTQPLNQIITDKLLFWLPDWYTVQDMKGYDPDKIKIMLALNLILNGFLAPYLEELYFRGYLLARMQKFGVYAFVINAVFFSLYHFWQPVIYLTLIISLLPMTYLVWKTKDLRVSILTHCLMNVVGAVASFAALGQH